MKSDTEKLKRVISFARILHEDVALDDFQRWNQMVGYLDYITEERVTK